MVSSRDDATFGVFGGAMVAIVCVDVSWRVSI